MYHQADGDAFSAGWAVCLVLAAMATLIGTAVVAASIGARMDIAVAIGQIGMLVVGIAAMRGGRRDVTVLGLARPRGRFVLAAIAIGLSAWYLNLHAVQWLNEQWPQTFEIDRSTRSMSALVEQPSLPIVLLTVAVAPAICEEVVFRGILTRGLATRFWPSIAVVISAVMFSAYHVKPIQLVPTLTLGLVFGALALRAGSAIPSMIAHFTNNAFALVVSRDDLPGLSGWLVAHGVIALGLATAATAGGIALIAWPDREHRLLRGTA